MRNAEMRELFEILDCHNDYCWEVIEELGGNPAEMENLERIYHENMELGIELCCELRAIGLDAHVDRLSGAVVDGKWVDLTETIDGEELRYFTFEYVEEDE